ncbi:hypothetical protein GCM10010358_29060 [Streptomyces minutiscleroticus]|uniref:Uncharacterized protein n=1 Tax=Streptomyces minutiscleroticus TaxID=68238 RepID=A0A918NJT5_9ACTN|nr:hypothetical protein GCM10010358_29060 [Streptomyces minutiscleroticus]
MRRGPALRAAGVLDAHRPHGPRHIADNHLSVEVAGRGSVRRRIHPLGAGHGDGWGWAASRHLPVFTAGPPMVPGLRVESVTVVRGRHELRVHRVTGAPAGARVSLTGWATGPGEPLASVLHPLYGFDGEAEAVPAPAGTAYARWARVPRLTGAAGGTSVHVALAVLTAEDAPVPAAEAVSGASVDGASVEVRWAEDGARTRVVFGPCAVEHTAGDAADGAAAR